MARLFDQPRISAHSVWDPEGWFLSLVGRDGAGAYLSLYKRSAKSVTDIEVAGWEKTYHGRMGRNCNVLIFRRGEDCLGLYSNTERVDLHMFSPNAAEMEALYTQAQSILDQMPEPVAPADKVVVSFWFNTAQGPRVETRTIAAPSWSDISGNYASAAQAKLDQLMALTPEVVEKTTARLIVLHGPPGTGKTTALRALAREWTWCETNYIMDPERLFGQADYLAGVLAGANDYNSKPWRLLIVEDADEFLRSDSKERYGQSISRLLNVGDGFIGQGLNLLVIMTVNSPIAKLQPAITRKGRCLGNIEVPQLSATEASRWLNRKTEEGVLADLFQRRGDILQIGEDLTTISAGQYL